MEELNGKVVNEENHKKVKTSLKKIGKICLIAGGISLLVGIILIIVGISQSMSISLDFNKTASNMQSSTILFVIGGILSFAGFAMCVFGIYATFFAHGREILSYTATTVAPVVKETTEYIVPTVEKVFESVSGGITKGIVKGKNAITKLRCPKCQALNPNGAKFCENCGAKFKTAQFCSKCGKELSLEAKFCPDCGTKVEE